ncbi:MAG TPA: hypothetical protein VM759_05080 [Longimicrobium sp.]|nr:hypothetical protein [Longimicrobium sp.]
MTARMRMYTDSSVEEAKAQMPILARSYAQIELRPDRGEATRIVARILVSGNDVFARENERIRQIARHGAGALDETVPAARTVAA